MPAVGVHEEDGVVVPEEDGVCTGRRSANL